jgi:hypothetical protein
MTLSLCYELISSAERNMQTARGRSTQCTSNCDPVTSTSELLLRQNGVTAHAHQSQARRLGSDHCATEIHRPKSAVRPILNDVKLQALYSLRFALSANVGTNFADKRRSLGRYSSLADSGHGVRYSIVYGSLLNSPKLRYRNTQIYANLPPHPDSCRPAEHSVLHVLTSSYLAVRRQQESEQSFTCYMFLYSHKVHECFPQSKLYFPKAAAINCDSR